MAGKVNIQFPVYHSFKGVQTFLRNEKFEKLAEVEQLLQIYEGFKLKEENSKNEGKRMPFIVLEGLDGCGKSSMSKKVAKALGGEWRSTPPTAIQSLRKSFDPHSQELRRAYYTVGNYIAGSMAYSTTFKKPVVMDRFWHSTAAYAIATAVDASGQELPPPGHPVYDWPLDLHRPDFVFFLDVSESNRLQRLGGRGELTQEEMGLTQNESFREKVVAAFKNMKDPGVTVIDANRTPKKITDEIVRLIGSTV